MPSCEMCVNTVIVSSDKQMNYLLLWPHVYVSMPKVHLYGRTAVQTNIILAFSQLVIFVNCYLEALRSDNLINVCSDTHSDLP